MKLISKGILGELLRNDRELMLLECAEDELSDDEKYIGDLSFEDSLNKLVDSYKQLDCLSKAQILIETASKYLHEID